MKPIPTWRESLDTPENTISPNHIHASVEEVQGAMQAEIDALRQRVQELEADAKRYQYRVESYRRTIPNATTAGRFLRNQRICDDASMKEKPDVEGHPV